ncbi:MAG: hypothetical protein WAQ53_05565 [Thiofilum sp.]|uniref:hypothetical protein n=1 Tax=Thiofilum sp. TaxID=2212733 RepID=UPI0025CC303B|nr:hypothetical protein [Thiofilum sp.]MBK8453482.1 hypothetical protein [Thiofilum sp.]
MKNKAELVWNLDVPLVNNPYLFRASIKLSVLTWLVMVILFSLILGATGEWDTLPPLLLGATFAALGLWVLMIVVMLLFFGNRMPMRFTINARQVQCDITSRRSKWANRTLIFLGLISLKPGAVGTGLIATSQESQAFEWERIYSATYDSKHYRITLRNRWRDLITLFCLPENYEAAVNRVQASIPNHKQTKHSTKNPIGSLLFRTVLTIIACLPFFQMPYPFEIDLFVPIFLVCFAVATIWLIPLFGYVVIATLLYIATLIIATAIQPHNSSYSSLKGYLEYELISGDEWVFFIIMLLCMTYLIRMSWRAVKGKDESALFLD